MKDTIKRPLKRSFFSFFTDFGIAISIRSEVLINYFPTVKFSLSFVKVSKALRITALHYSSHILDLYLVNKEDLKSCKTVATPDKKQQENKTKGLFVYISAPRRRSY